MFAIVCFFIRSQIQQIGDPAWCYKAVYITTIFTFSIKLFIQFKNGLFSVALGPD